MRPGKKSRKRKATPRCRSRFCKRCARKWAHYTKLLRLAYIDGRSLDSLPHVRLARLSGVSQKWNMLSNRPRILRQILRARSYYGLDLTVLDAVAHEWSKPLRLLTQFWRFFRVLADNRGNFGATLRRVQH